MEERYKNIQNLIDQAVDRSIKKQFSIRNGGHNTINKIITIVVSSIILTTGANFVAMKLNLELFGYRLQKVEEVQKGNIERLERSESCIRQLRAIHGLPPDLQYIPRTRGDTISLSF